ncbi:MAG: 50S ribosomal protein L10 [Nanoarchaeota archaeon]
MAEAIVKHKAHVAAKKKQVVADFKKLIDQYEVIGAVDLENLPARQLQVMKDKLRGKVVLRMTKKRLMNIALDQSKKEGISKLKDHFRGMPALLFSNENPFGLYSTIKKNKSKAPIKAGQKAPNDIVVPAGPTSFAPGPVIGELGAFRIKTGIENGKVVIKEDAVVAKEGTIISAKLAGILQRLGIQPMEIGLELRAVYEKGEILTKAVLDVDEDKVFAQFQQAASMTFNLAFNAGFPTKETITHMIAKAANDAKALAIAQDILTSETAPMIVAKAERQARVLKESIPEAAATSSSPDSEGRQDDK